jgi:hypothetical protein
MGHMEVPELSCVRRREPGSWGTWLSQSYHGPLWRELLPRGMWQLQSYPVPGDGSRRTSGHVVVLELPWALVAGAATTRHVAAPEQPCAKGWVLRDTRACVPILPFVFDLKLVHGGIRSSG